MKKLATLFVVGSCFWAAGQATAQTPDRAPLDQCASKLQKTMAKMAAVRDEKETALRELQQGYFCSKCRNSKTTIEKGNESFEAHLGRVSGVRVPATQEEINANQSRFLDKIHSLYLEKDSNEKECERLTTAYANDQKAAKDRVEQEALHKVQKDYEDRKKQEVTDKENELAEKKRKEAQQYQDYLADRARLAAEWQKREEARQQREQQKMANTQILDDQVANNNADRDAKLEDHRQNSNLNGISTFSNETKQTAQGTVASTNTTSLNEKLYGKAKYLGDVVATGRSYVREKLGLDNKIEFKDWKGTVFYAEGQEPPSKNTGVLYTIKSSGKEVLHEVGSFMSDGAKKVGIDLDELSTRYQAFRKKDFMDFLIEDVQDKHKSMAAERKENADKEAYQQTSEAKAELDVSGNQRVFGRKSSDMQRMLDEANK